MFIKILLLSIVTGIVGLNTPFNVEKTIKYDEVVTTESIKQRNYQHNVNVNGVLVNYKYETNEVNSINDLVVGNIYHLETSSSETTWLNICNVDFIHGYRDTLEEFRLDVSTTQNATLTNVDDDELRINYSNSSGTYNIYFSKNSYGIDFVYKGSFDLSFIGYVSSTEFNIIESVTYQQPQTIIGYINDFLESNLLGEIPFIRDINFEIGGQNINLLTWAIMFIGFIIVGLLIFAFIKLIIWLVKIFSNSFLLR